MKFPYGSSDFQRIIQENFFYIDRTGYIPLIEAAGDQLLFLRPRRFGKSLWLSVLENYYDLAKADRFEQLFGQLEIGKNPTAKHNAYFVLKWDFSMVSPSGTSEDIKKSLHNHLNSQIEDFSVYYENHIKRAIRINPDDAAASFGSLLTACKNAGHPLYLLIDEYDNFANEVMMSIGSGEKRYSALVHGEGVMRSLFRTVKGAAAGMGLERVFITGVSPVAMSDITSAYNVAKSIYLKPLLNDLCGFREAELAEALCRIVENCNLPREEAEKGLEMMRIFYDGYRFAYEAGARVYNPTLALYFLEEFQERCTYPRRMLDDNLSMDRNRISYVSRLEGGARVLAHILDTKDPLSIARLASRFSVDDMLHAPKDDVFMASLLYYLGVLTLGGETPMGETVMDIPNLMVRGLYLERMREMRLPRIEEENTVKAVARELYNKGDIQPLCEFIETKRMQLFDNRDYRWANELTIKTVFLMLLAEDTFYFADSETALERNYADMTLIVRPDMRRYELLDILVEFKFVSLQDVKLNGEQVSKLGFDELCALPAVQRKQKEAEEKLPRYAGILRDKYQDLLRLRSFCVTAVGFERLIWKEITHEAAE
ncbi:MAG: AAA family ATPase [Gammaproteobacteria bacterium]|nr:AAA family ATPase [Gammaproteobacteria bacterium]